MSDAAARAAALDPTRSFIVQAPAGSGKTELLIQRYLSLLATVEHPEQVVAITFTRKAAAEMRRRVQEALRAAESGRRGTEAHERATLELAHAVVGRDRERDWALLTEPQRLRVDTLDAFNIWLAHQLPVLADGVAAAGIVEKPEALYREAAHKTVTGILDGGSFLSAQLRTLLRGVDNDAEQLERLLAALLARRDRWLPLLAGSTPLELRGLLEGALERLVDDELEAAAARLGEPVLHELVPLLRHAASHAAEGLRTTLKPWLALEQAPKSGPLALAAWRGVAALLLTKSGDWRRRIAKSEGFGPAHSALGDRCRAIIAALNDDEELRLALRNVASLPDPSYTPLQWDTLLALQHVLVRLAAELKVAFSEGRVVDFVELALAAQRALGQVDAPSELLLALDRRIHHVLVDEFQDTSQSQLRLLELLTAGWQHDDGRTLFLVGDPMQSIYRFRDADMSLFLRAKRHGIGSVVLTSLTLERNFRSAPAVVEWVNHAFSRVFPSSDDLARGASGFRASAAARAQGAEQFVTTHARSEAEAERVVEILAVERTRAPGQSIAVLVQSRTHLEGLRERLRGKGWPVHAVEIDSLGEQTVAQDLLGLTRALLHLSDRIAWLAVLRAPWCGLTWIDLDALCHDSSRRCVLDLLHDSESLARLSDDGRKRARSAVFVLDAAFANRDGAPLAAWVKRTWLELGGDVCLDGDAEELAAEQFFALLAGAERHGDLDDPAQLHTLLAAAQPQGDAPREKGIEIMTMHRAKGLEFDTVVLCGLARELRPDDPKALQWLTRVAADGRDDLLMVPGTLSGDRDAERLADFVQKAERERAHAERARLLYVAATRARERLHLVWALAPDKPAPPSASMLGHLWPTLAESERTPAVAQASERAERVEELVPVLRRFADIAVRDEAAVPDAAHVVTARPEFSWAGHAAVHVGTLVHRYLQRIAELGLESFSRATVSALKPKFVSELELLGVDSTELDRAATRVVDGLTGALTDERGRWVLKARASARSELRLAVDAGDFVEHLRLDRTFVEDDRRWIIDFKTSTHEGGDVDAFLDSEVTRYGPQLERYARTMTAIDGLPVSVALYFPLLGAFRSWDVATASPST
jgi:ATP-dependent helicase/nuclease subunit A